LKTQKNEENTFYILPNQLYMFSHRISSYKTSKDIKECIPIYSFELNFSALPIDKFQFIEEHDRAQNNILEMHSLMSHSSYTNLNNNFIRIFFRDVHGTKQNIKTSLIL
jgi:hypothetical protein